MHENFLKQAQELQRRMEEVQKKLENHEVTGYAAGGLVEFTLSGKLDPLSLRISKQVLKDKLSDDILDKLDLTELEDVLLVAFRDAKERAEKHVQTHMAAITQDMNLGG